MWTFCLYSACITFSDALNSHHIPFVFKDKRASFKQWRRLLMCTQRAESMSFLNLRPVCIYLLLFTARLLQRSVTLFGVAPLFSLLLSLSLPRTFPFSQRQNKLIRSEVRSYQRGISIQIKALSGHKQQEAKQDPGAAE